MDAIFSTLLALCTRPRRHGTNPALAPRGGTDGVAEDMDAIAEDGALPELGDRGLWNTLMEFDRYRQFLDNAQTELASAIEGYAPGTDAKVAIENLKRVFAEVGATIYRRRRERFVAHVIHLKAMERLRGVIEAELLTDPPVVPIFDDVALFLAGDGEE